MSNFVWADDGDHVKERNGEHYEVSSCYSTPRSVHPIKLHNDPVFAALEIDVDELMNKPRRFFDHLLSIMEHKRDNDPIKNANHAAYWEHIIRGCELWLSAVENGLYGEAIRLATPVPSEKSKHKELLDE